MVTEEKRTKLKELYKSMDNDIKAELSREKKDGRYHQSLDGDSKEIKAIQKRYFEKARAINGKG